MSPEFWLILILAILFAMFIKACVDDIIAQLMAIRGRLHDLADRIDPRDRGDY